MLVCREKTLSMANDSRPLLVFFGATHSGPARRMESLMAHLARKERAACA